ncbi:MAG: diguanylate cyclase [Ktedonobacteraceae bacterium]|nr:diguanylate cyclase [Ktedonobacteraceae bacterium]
MSRTGIQNNSIMATPDLCTCLSLSAQYHMDQPEATGDRTDYYKKIVPAPQELFSRLHAELKNLLPVTRALSIMILHIVQVEQMPATGQPQIIQQRRYYHAPAGLLEQILANISRVTRRNDLLLTQEGGGAAMVFPGADQYGAHSLLERIESSIDLLQAETVIPPLTRVTIIAVGIGTYPDPATSLEELLHHTERAAYTMTLHPALPARFSAGTAVTGSTFDRNNTYQSYQEQQEYQELQIIPFMKLPPILPRRLSHLIPYQAAVQFRCVPVGRTRRHLTVAMQTPHDTAIVRQLEQLTGMHIFPVGCSQEELDLLLAQQW